MSNIKNCLVCGKEFKPCNTCQKGVDEMFQWRRVVCCPEHFLYHMPIIQYTRGKIDKAAARKDLQSAIDTYGNIEFCNNIKSIVDDILSKDIVNVDTFEEKFTENVSAEGKKHKNKNKE